MKKTWLIALSLVLWLSVLAGCNPTKNIPTQTNLNTNNNKWWFNVKNITVYVDKNCEDSNIPQCKTQNIKKWFAQNLSGTQVDVLYTDDKINKEINKVKETTPLLIIPENKLSKFWAEAEWIKKQAKKEWNNYLIPLYGWIAGEENLCNDGKDNNKDGRVDAKDPTCFKMDVLSSSKCKKQYCNPQLFKNIFIWYSINIIDVNTQEWKQIYDKLKQLNGQQYLPTFLFNKQKNYIDKMKQFVKEHKENCKYKYQINIPQFKYDPSIEACSTNCNASPACKKILSCNKTDKPKVELFVMSYCPFGTQAEKWILPVVNLLKNKIDFKIKFVNYSMHGKKEIDENNLQYCIQKEEPTKYNTYLTCFLNAWKQKDCITKAKLDMKKENACIENVKKQFKTEENYNNQASWLNGRFPRYEVYNDLNIKYWVQGSPTLVINWIKVESGRSPQAYLKTICSAFKNPPKECNQQLSNQSYDPMWWWTQNGKAAPAWSCGK